MTQTHKSVKYKVQYRVYLVFVKQRHTCRYIGEAMLVSLCVGMFHSLRVDRKKAFGEIKIDRCKTGNLSLSIHKCFSYKTFENIKTVAFKMKM